MEEQYVEPTTSGRIRALVPAAVYLLAGAIMYWLAGIIAERNKAELAKYNTADYRDLVPIVTEQLLEMAWLLFVAFLLMAGHVFWMTRAIQLAGRMPIPNQPVLFRTRVRTDPQYIKWVVVVGYVTSGLVLFSGLLGFYAWYSFRNIFR